MSKNLGALDAYFNVSKDSTQSQAMHVPHGVAYMTESKIKLNKGKFQGVVNMSADNSHILHYSKNMSTQNDTAPDTITSSHY